MGLNRKYKLGALIEQCTDINDNGEYTAEDVRGMTITKEVITTKANVENTDLSNFLIIRPKEFIYNPRTHGKRIGFGFNDSDTSFIISWNNIGFRVKKEAEKIVIPEYLFMHFNRLEWDREACYRSWGTSTEVFSWDALCGMEIELPRFEAQQKAVDIYNGLKENLAAYESGLEELKLTCDGFIDDLKHHAPKEKIVNLLHEVDNRNEEVGITDVKGINIDKQFMPTIAKIDESSLGKYKIVKPGQFAFSGMQTGRDCCIRIALLSGRESVIVSPAYTTLEIKENIVIPEYIMLWFSRGESDRYGWFASDGSVRSNLDLDRFYGIEIPLPDIKIQRAIADIYSCYIERKRIAEELKKQLNNICPILLQGAIMAGD